MRIHHAFLLASVLASAATADAGSLRGTVRRSGVLTPLAGADVTVHVLIPDSLPFPAVTGSDGSYDITGIIPDNEIYVVIAWKSGFRSSYTRIADLGAQDLVLDIVLEPDTAAIPPGGGGDSGTVSGTVYEVVPGGELQGLPDVLVSVYGAGSVTTTPTSADGDYSVRIPAGSFALGIAGAGIDSMAIAGLTVDSLGASVNAVVRKVLTDVPGDGPLPPQRYRLAQNYPNPFNPLTAVRYALPEGGLVRLAVYDVLGREVAVLVDGFREAGESEVVFDASGLPTGAYACRLSAGAHRVQMRMLHVR